MRTLAVIAVLLFPLSPRNAGGGGGGEGGSPPSPPQPLRICADPNNLPFSNSRLEGFENRLALLLAKDLGRKIEWVFRPQRRGFVRETLGAGLCDVIPGVPAGFERTLNTRPWYRSTYVFVTRRADGPPIASLDDPRLRTVRIGVQLVGDDGANTPPVHALAARGIVDNVVGYTIFGDYREPNPPARVVEAVANGDVDVAIAWGPLAGWIARRARTPLALAPVRPSPDGDLPFAYAIAIGVRRGDDALRDALQGALDRRRAAVERILREAGVPRVEEPP